MQVNHHHLHPQNITPPSCPCKTSDELACFTMDSMDMALTMDYSEYDNYTADNLTYEEVSVRVHPTCSEDVLCMMMVVINSIIFLLGIIGNGLVIWIASFKMKKSVNTTWYLSLAVSDFLFCSFLPFNIFYMATSEWSFGLFMCKFMSFVMFLNMFSSIFLLVIISADRCVSVMFPVWAQNQRTVGKALVMVSLAWIISAALSVPSIIFRDVQQHLGTSRCHTNYATSQHSHTAIATSRLTVGFLIPFLIIITCYSIIIFKLRSNHMARLRSTKPFKIMTALIMTFFLCWLPYHTVMLMELYQSLSVEVIPIAIKAGSLVASANSFLNPILYVFMGNDFRRKFKSSLLSKMENAMGEEGRTTSRYLSRSSSMDARASTHI
ncbi:chemerin-like receptor 1 [Brachyhypopomus gauderio]|uniref:chemerin-like receptor 1 n=1 Tax=Brachyhypopomus gauderio TaxID=698409 RepID=UPI0040414A9C